MTVTAFVVLLVAVPVTVAAVVVAAGVAIDL